MSTINSKRTRKYFKTFKIYEDLFDGTRGNWNTAPVELEFKDDVNPLWLQNYPVPILNEEMF